MTKQAKKQKPTIQPFNPFTVTIEGLNLLFSRAQPVGLFLIAVAVAGIVFGIVNPSPDFTKDPTGHATETAVRAALEAPLSVQLTWGGMAVVIALFILVVTTMIQGISAYTAVQLSKGFNATLGEAFNATLENFGRFFLLIFWMNIKIFLWGLLFVIPGIMAYYRYSFAPLLFFDQDKQLRGEAALQESARLTQKGRLTIFASQFLFNIITFFYADRIIVPSSLAVLYREYTALDEAKAPKPAPHILSRLALLLPLVVVVGFIMMSILFFAFIGAVGSRLTF